MIGKPGATRARSQKTVCPVFRQIFQRFAGRMSQNDLAPTLIYQVNQRHEKRSALNVISR
jgi:hypothetical protein